ncbi:MAG: hypothetical protein IJX42_01530, partial [Oscillospiraceae bacterium]|nr:hypothetical protein [Oscillospiraceae bacterium]
WFFIALWGIVSLIIVVLNMIFIDWGMLFFSLLVLFPINCFVMSILNTRHNGIQPTLLIPIIITALVYLYLYIDFDEIQLHLIYVGAIVIGAFLGRLYIKKEDENNEN